MYAAMTDIMKDAVIRVYEEAGWDMSDTGLPCRDEWHYPDFRELMHVLVSVIDSSDYSREVKDNYKGSLQTRIKSMLNGMNKRIFGEDCMTCEELFSKNIILDISGITSSENRALMMGILIIRLNEFRRIESINAGINSSLKHVTLIEEAHNLLSRTQGEHSGDGTSVSRKSSELIINAIAEMRSYGEGFIIVDQTPSKLDSSIIANTAVKIAFNLQNNDDSLIIGRAMSLTDEQVQDIPTLPQGVCIVRSRGWVASVKVKVGYFSASQHKPFQLESYRKNVNLTARGKILTAIISGNVKDSEEALSEVQEDTNLVNAFEVVKKGGKLSGYQKTKLYAEVFESASWFYTPSIDKIYEWDEYVRSQLSRRAKLDKPLQDKIIQTLLITQGKNIKPEILKAWMASNGTKGEN